MICKNCGFENEKETLNCQECGEKLETLDEKTEEVVETVAEEVGETVDVPEEPYIIENEIEETKKSKIPLLIGLVVIGVLLIASISYAALGGFANKKSDEEKLVDAYEKTHSARQSVIQGTLAFDNFELSGENIPSSFVLGPVIESFTLNYRLAYDIDAKKVEGSLALTMGRVDFITASIQLNEDYFALEIPELYDKMLYVKWDELGDYLLEMGVITEEDLIEYNKVVEYGVVDKIIGYMDAIDVEELSAYKDVDVASYEAIIYDAVAEQIDSVESGELEFEIMDEDITIEGDVYSFDLDYGKMIDAIVELMIKFAEDDSIEPVVIELIDKFFDVAIEQEDIMVYNLYEATEGGESVDAFNDTVIDGYNTLRDELKEAVQDEYEDMMEELLDAIDSSEMDDMLSVMKDALEIVEIEMEAIVSEGYLSGAKLEYSITDEMIKALSELNLEENAHQMESDIEVPMDIPIDFEIEDLMGDVNMDITLVNEIVFTNLDQAIEFDALTDDAVNITDLDQMGLMQLLMEVQENLQVITESFDF